MLLVLLLSITYWRWNSYNANKLIKFNLFMIVFGIQCTFFIVLPIRLKKCRYNTFFFYKARGVRPNKRACLRGFAHRARNLSRLVIYRITCTPLHLWFTLNFPILGYQLNPWNCNAQSKENKVASEAFARRCSLKKMFIEISQNSPGNTCTGDSF